MLELYHGSNVAIDKIDLSKGHINKDFGKGFHHDYDIVVGPVADDSVVQQLDLFEMGLITLSQLVEALRYRNINNQYFFGTERAVAKLIRI